MNAQHIAVADYIEAVAALPEDTRGARDRLNRLEETYGRCCDVDATDLVMEAHKRASLLMTTMRCSMREAQLAVAEELRRDDEGSIE